MPIYREHGVPLRQPRLPRLGIIRLGVKVAGKSGAYPKATDYFVLTDAKPVAELFGATPTVLEPVILPSGGDEEEYLSHWYRYYTQTWGLTCRGNGLMALRLVDETLMQETGEPVPASHHTAAGKVIRKDINCPCPLLDSGQCREVLFLRIVLPTVPGFGVWQIGTSSVNSIANLMGSIALVKSLTGGRISDIPLRLSLAPQVVHPIGKGAKGKKTVHVLRLDVVGHTMQQMLTGEVSYAKTLLPPSASAPTEEEEPPEDYIPGEPLGDAAAPEAEDWGDRMTRDEIAQAQAEAEEAAAETPAQAAVPGTGTATPDELGELTALIFQRKAVWDAVTAYASEKFGKAEALQLTSEEVVKLRKWIRATYPGTKATPEALGALKTLMLQRKGNWKTAQAYAVNTFQKEHTEQLTGDEVAELLAWVKANYPEGKK